MAPILLICYDRPDLAAPTIKYLLTLPCDLYLFRDGGGNPETENKFRLLFAEALGTPRHHKIEVRWEKKNLGPQQGPWAAIQWFFSENTMGIVLEEDIQPNHLAPNIYSRALETFQTDKSIFALGGAPNKNVTAPGPNPWTKSPLFLVWGWASWADRILPLEIPNPKSINKTGINSLASLTGRLYMSRELDNLLANPNYCWSYYLQLHIWEKKLCVLIPETKLTQNLGIGKDARRSKTNPDQPPEPNACRHMWEKPPLTNPPNTKWQKQIETAKFLGIVHEIRNRLKIKTRLRKILKKVTR